MNSNINIYSIISTDTSIGRYFSDYLLISEITQIPSNKEIDKFENSNNTPQVSYLDGLQSKIKPKKTDNSRNEEKSPEEKKEIERLQQIDQRVRAHEQAHHAAGAGLIRGGTSFEYTRGPDGKMYAVRGEVKIDISPVPGKPDETIRKMQRVISAALAPVDPSPQDRAVATIARNIQAKAQMEKNQETAKKGYEMKSSANFNTVNNTDNISKQIENKITTDNKQEQKNDKIKGNQKVIKQYIINNPYPTLDRILFKTV